MDITNEQQLTAHLKILKFKLRKEGVTEFNLYPAFCMLYDKTKERYKLPTAVVLDKACEILIEQIDLN